MKKKTLFRKGDIVYHFKYGEGRVIRTYTYGDYRVRVLFKNSQELYFTKDGRTLLSDPKTLSFTPYNLIDGGLSQKRLTPDIDKGTLIYVRRNNTAEWRVRKFSHFVGESIHCYEQNSDIVKDWNHYSLEEPEI